MSEPISSHIELSLRLIALVLLGIRQVYWTVTEARARQAKPTTKPRTVGDGLKRAIAGTAGVIMALQLAGILNLWPFPGTLANQGLGLALVIIGFAVSIAARRTLGDNWAHAADYQIKSGHTLVTTGIYRYVRHPIYTGIILTAVGSELVVHSWLAVACLIVLATLGRFQARQEEAILLEQFGDEYRAYMKRSAQFIPGLW